MQVTYTFPSKTQDEVLALSPDAQLFVDRVQEIRRNWMDNVLRPMSKAERPAERQRFDALCNATWRTEWDESGKVHIPTATLTIVISTEIAL